MAPSYDGSIAGFLSRAPEPVPAEKTIVAVDLLKKIEALDCFEELTEFGHHMVDLSIPPQLAKMVLYGLVLKCLDPVLTIACILAYKDPFVLPPTQDQRNAQQQARRRFEAGVFSDHMAQLRAFQAWQDAKAEGWESNFCQQNFINPAAMDMIVGMRSQLLGQLRASGFVRTRGASDIRDLNSNSEHWAVVKAALAAGLYPNIAYLDKIRQRIVTNKHKRCRYHVSSIFRSTSSGNVSCPTSFVVYDELSKAGGITNLRGCTAVTSTTILLICGPSRLENLGAEIQDAGNSDVDSDGTNQKPTSNGIVRGVPGVVGEEAPESQLSPPPFENRFKVDDFLKFNISAQACSLIQQTRIKLQAMILRRIRSPGKQPSPPDEALLQKVVAILLADEQVLGIPAPDGFGKRPRPVVSESVLSTPLDADVCNDIPISSSSQEFSQASGTYPGLGNYITTLTPSSSGSIISASTSSPSISSVPGTTLKVFSPPRSGASRRTFVFVVSCMRTLHDFHEARRLEMWNASGPEQAGRFSKILAESGTIYILYAVDATGGFNG